MSSRIRLRADAARNRERILTEARRLFAKGGSPVSLDAIARTSGVGIGTLYRHFPTKESLADAVYSDELDALDLEADDLLETESSFAAMRQWLDRYVTFVATKHAMHDALRIALSPQAGTLRETRVRMNVTLAKFLQKGAEDSGLRQDFQPDDITLAFAGAVYAAISIQDRQQIGRILDLLTAGLRPTQQKPCSLPQISSQ